MTRTEKRGETGNTMTGIDITEAGRFEKLLESRDFLNRIYTESEKKHIFSRKKREKQAETAAGIFAAKEAVSKALGTGIGKIGWKDIEILRNEKGAPKVRLNRESQITGSMPEDTDIHISITHDCGIAAAVCFIYFNGNGRKVMKENIRLPKRKLETNKGDYGKLAVIGGSVGMAGAPCMSSFSALRTGSGLVYTAVPSSISEIAAIKSLENIVVPLEDGNKGYFSDISLEDFKNKLSKADTIAVGPGMGNNPETEAFLKGILELGKPAVIDADGLNIIARNKNLLDINENIILTPHLMEFSRLVGTDIREIQRDRDRFAEEFIEKYNLTLVLKGNRTLVINRNGRYVNSTGNPGMATAGSGDVLTGIIASLIGQKLDLFEAAKTGVYLHGLAGDIAAREKGEYSMIAGDIIEYLPEAVKLIVGDE